MVGFASAGTRFATHVRDENAWAFQSLSLILAGSRGVLAIQYTINAFIVHRSMKVAAKGISYTATVFWLSTVVYSGVCATSSQNFPLETQGLH